MTAERRSGARPTLALLSRPLLSLPPSSARPPVLGPSLPASLPPLWEPVCPCWTDTVAIRAEESWRPDYRERPVLTHPGLANGASVRISELLGGHLTDTNCRGGEGFIAAWKKDQKEIHFGSLLIQRSRHFVDS